MLEVFGFGEEGSRRFHVGQIQGIELGDGPMGMSMFVADVGPAAIGLKMALKLSDGDRERLLTLIEEVRAAGGAGS